MVLNFHRATKDFKAGEHVTVTQVVKEGLTVQRADGKELRITRKQTGCFDVARTERLGIAPGDQLLIKANRKQAGLLNGQLATVKQIHQDGRIGLTDGRTIPADFHTFTYGYCVTSQGSQGKTVDHVYVAVDSRSGPAANLKQFYVSASRGRERIKLYTDDKDQLRDAMTRSGIRQSALELVKPRGRGLDRRAAASNRQDRTARRGMHI